MPSLLDVQRAMQRSLLQDEAGHAAELVVGAGLAPAQRLGVYRNTIVATLANALRLSYPAVHRLVGADFFEGAAQIFAHDQAPRCADLNAYGAGFPDFLQGFAPAATLAYLPDVARLEWAVNRALHAPDVKPLDLAHLASVPQSAHSRVCFVPHPSLSAIRADFPVDTIWRAVLGHDEAVMATIDLADGPICLVVQRARDGVEVLRADEPAWRFMAALCAGQPLGFALSASPGADVPGLLAVALAAGRFVEFHVGCRSNDNEPGENVL
jgi:hypothetical protein